MPRTRKTVGQSLAGWPESIPIPSGAPAKAKAKAIAERLRAAADKADDGADFLAIAGDVAAVLGTFAKAAI